MKTHVKRFFTVTFLLVSSVMLAQQNISGTVMEQDTGGGLPGVTIVISGTDRGTTTDFDGNLPFPLTKEMFYLYPILDLIHKKLLLEMKLQS